MTTRYEAMQDAIIRWKLGDYNGNEAVEAIDAILATILPEPVGVSRDKELEGWKAEAESLKVQLDASRRSLRLMSDHTAGEYWAWQGDGQDYLRSMSNDMPVLIRADDLRGLISAKPDPVAVPDGYHLVADTTLRSAIVSLIDRVTSHQLSCNETAVEQLRFINQIAAAPQPEAQQPAQNFSAMIHYPEHWDTAAYPTLDSAITEILLCTGCSECKTEQPGQDEQRVCISDECGWIGPLSDTVHPKHDASMILCPECHEVTELAQPAQALTDDEIDGIVDGIIFGSINKYPCSIGSVPSWELRKFARAIEARLKC